MTKAKSICKKLNEKARAGTVSFDDVNDINGLQLLGGAAQQNEQGAAYQREPEKATEAQTETQAGQPADGQQDFPDDIPF